MKRLLATLAIAVAAGVLGYFLVGARHAADLNRLAQVRGTDLEWIRAEFRLDEAQFAAVARLHEQYAGVCAQHCTAILAARSGLDELRRTGAPGEEIAAAAGRLTALEDVCNEQTRAHLEQVAACMTPEQGGRFLRTIAPHLAQLPHDLARSPVR